MKSDARHHATRRGTLLFFPLLLVALGATARAGTVVSGPVAHSDTSTLTSPYGKPNQHRLWYNSYQHGWDGLIPKNDGGSSASDHYIMKDVAVNQIFTSVQLEDRNVGRPDIFWDNAGKRLYVLGSHSMSSTFWLVDYENLTDTYTINPAVAGVAVPGITHQNTNDPASLYVTPNGVVWVAVMRDGGLYVQRSGDGGATWLPAAINLNSAAVLGVTAWTHFTRQGITYASLFATENATPGNTTHFSYWRIPQDADPTVASSWTDENAKIPHTGQAVADDHVNAARDSLENEYFAVKTQEGNPDDPLIDLFRRTRDGGWSQFEVTATHETPEQSRPSIVIDEERGDLSIYTSDTNGGLGNRKRARLSALQDLARAPLTPIFGAGSLLFTDLISPREHVSSATGLVVLAHDMTDRTMWYSAEDLAAQSVCAITPGALTLLGHELQWQLANVGDVPATISRIDLTWPPVLGDLKDVKRNGDPLYKTKAHPPSIEITFQGGDPKKRTIPVAETDTIKFSFVRNATTTPSDYRIHIEFEQGCHADLAP